MFKKRVILSKRKKWSCSFNEVPSNGSETSLRNASIHSTLIVIWASPENIKSIDCSSKQRKLWLNVKSDVIILDLDCWIPFDLTENTLSKIKIEFTLLKKVSFFFWEMV